MIYALGGGVVFALLGCVALALRIAGLNRELSDEKESHAATEADLSDTKTDLAAKEQELSEAADQIDGLEEVVANGKNEISRLRGILAESGISSGELWPGGVREVED